MNIVSTAELYVRGVITFIQEENNINKIWNFQAYWTEELGQRWINKLGRKQAKKRVREFD